ncbi:MAG: site-2 protease family protein [Candidatus Parcubacteria bacterium]|nr:site-2 protease family protein [Candidatus Parcubacteria bacterium]
MPSQSLFEFKIFLYLVIVFSAVLHEYFHGWTAYYLGDTTAKDARRLTLNPLKHMDPLGTFLIPLALLFYFGGFIGWAKPVPYNPNNLRDQKFGSTKVAFAGPAANFFIALLFGLILRFIPLEGLFYVTLTWVVYINIFLGLFNLIPIPPLDGSKLIMDLFPRSFFIQIMGNSIFGMILAFFMAITFLPYIAGLAYFLITGQFFLGLVF